MTNVLTNQFLTNPMVQLQTPHRTDTSQTARNPVKCADVFSFDDMLASCVAEITKNGMDTLAVPDTIKDWVAGKLLRAFPKQLTQRLLNFMMEQRDFEGLLAFRECRTGDVPEFTGGRTLKMIKKKYEKIWIFFENYIFRKLIVK